ncbi:MAG: hypothetical protein J07HN4v3_01234, partial [Halonotius sp. J07HN4]
MDRHGVAAVQRLTLLRALLVAVLVVPLLAVVSGSVLAHASALRGSTTTVSVPTWLFLSTGGGAVGAS